MIQYSVVEQRMRGASVPVHLGGSLVGQKGHICAFFSSADEEYRTLLPFIKDGLDGGEAAFHTIDPARADDHVNRHRAAGIDVDAYRRNGQLELRTWNEVHLLGEFNVMLTRELLLRRGHDVNVVRSGMDALAELEKERYDVLLLDLHMPEMDGFEVIRNLRAREQLRGGHLPVIALTARARPADRESCLAAGMDDFLAKPINSTALWGAVERVSVS